jgi:S1-C subfamily serine protease
MSDARGYQSNGLTGASDRSRRQAVIGGLAVATAAALADAAAFRRALAQKTPRGITTLAPLLKKIMPAVVSIQIKGRLPPQPGAKKREVREFHDLGSGVVYDAEHGYIVTNNHVVEHADEITVTLTDGRSVKAKRIGADPDFDIAVVQVQDGELTSIPFADSRDVQVGDFVLAIGYPMGIGQSVTSGIVSGLHRSKIGLEQYENFIQTDAAVYPGNSGGALVSLQGDLVGINTAFIGASSTNPGMGFAIPINMARTIADQILMYGDIRRGSLGLTFDELPADTIRELKLSPPQNGAVISKVDPGSSGERAGFKKGDVVTEVGERPVLNAPFLRTRLALLRVGEMAELSVMRDGKPMSLRATVARPDALRESRTAK